MSVVKNRRKGVSSISGLSLVGSLLSYFILFYFLGFKCLFVQCLTIYKILSHISHLMIGNDYFLHTREQN